MIPRLKTIVLLSLAALCVPAFGTIAANPEIAARPGTVNYIEGSVFLQGKPLTPQSVGSAEIAPGEVLSTNSGKAEVLMTPGVYLRLDDHSSVKMISSDLTFTQLGLERGRAAVEVDQIYPQNNLQILQAGIPTEMLKTGFYEFNANDGMARVFKGKAAARLPDGKWVVIKSNHELALSAGDDALKPQKFNAKAAEDDFYNWNSLRSQYLSEANAQLSRQYYGYGFAPGWYWNPYYLGYTFMGPSLFYSPFGWGFYPFGYAGYAPGYYGGFGFYGHGFHRNHWIGHAFGGGRRGSIGHGRIGGFHGGIHAGGFHGGGFHGGIHAGGFHGGGHR